MKKERPFKSYSLQLMCLLLVVESYLVTIGFTPQMFFALVLFLIISFINLVAELREYHNQ